MTIESNQGREKVYEGLENLSYFKPWQQDKQRKISLDIFSSHFTVKTILTRSSISANYLINNFDLVLANSHGLNHFAFPIRDILLKSDIYVENSQYFKEINLLHLSETEQNILFRKQIFTINQLAQFLEDGSPGLKQGEQKIIPTVKSAIQSLDATIGKWKEERAI